MIEKLPFTEIHTGGEDMVDLVEFRPVAPYEMQHKINELVDAVNSIVSVQEKLIDSRFVVETKHEAPAENVQQVSYMAPGDITVFHGFNCSVEFDTPLPKGTRITIKSITKGGDNE